MYISHYQSVHCQREQKRMTYLLETLLADGLRVDLYLEDNGVGLTDEAPHLRDRSFLGDLRICVELIPRRTPATNSPLHKNQYALLSRPTFTTKTTKIITKVTMTITTVSRSPDTRLVGDRSSPVVRSLS